MAPAQASASTARVSTTLARRAAPRPGRAGAQAPVVASKAAVIPPDVRKMAATGMNKLVDIPLLNESQEQKLFETAVGLVCAVWEKELMRDENFAAGVEALSGWTPERQKEWRDKAVDEINRRVDLPVFNEEQEAVIIGAVLDAIIAHFSAPPREKFLGLF